jgi:hypothetical protein
MILFHNCIKWLCLTIKMATKVFVWITIEKSFFFFRDDGKTPSLVKIVIGWFPRTGPLAKNGQHCWIYKLAETLCFWKRTYHPDHNHNNNSFYIEHLILNITRFVTRVTRRIQHVEKDLLPFRSIWVHPRRLCPCHKSINIKISAHDEFLE